MNAVIFLGYAAIHAVLFGWALNVFFTHRTPSSVPLLLVTAGLIYDNTMVGIGGAMGAGEMLAYLSIPRFFLHALTTPLLMLTAAALAARALKAPRPGRIIMAFAAALTLLAIAIGFWQDMINLELEIEIQDGILSYGNQGSAGIPIAPMLVTAFLWIAGGLVWWKNGIPWLALGAIAQFAAAMLADLAVFIGNVGEVALLAGLVGTHWQMHRDGDAKRQSRSL